MWKKVGVGGLRYGIIYAGITVLVVGFATRSELAVALLFITGLLILLFVFGVGDVRTGEILAEGGSYDMDSQLADSHVDRHQYVSSDEKLLFFGLGLTLLGFGAMVFIGEFLR